MSNRSDDSYILYSAPLSLYSGKTRSFLRKSGVAFDERLPSHPDYMEKVFPKTGKFWLPVLEAPDGTIVQDTTEIADYLVGKGATSPTPTEPRRKITALILELFGDEGLLRAAMHYRWNFPDTNQAFITHEFRNALTPPQFSDEDRDKMADGAMARMQSYLPGLGITEETIPHVEQAYLELLATLGAHFDKMPYVLGFEPTIADYGLMGPLYAHLGRDPYPMMVMKKHAPRVARWVERMNAADAEVPEFGHLAAIDETDFISPTLLPVLKLVATDYLPVLTALVEASNTYLEQNPDLKAGDPVSPEGESNFPPRIEPEIRGQSCPMRARSTALWMLGRVQGAFDDLAAEDQQAVTALLGEANLGDLLETRLSRGIERKNCKEVWSPQAN